VRLSPHRRALGTLGILVGAASPLAAQAPEYQGLSGGIVLGVVRYRLDDRLPPAQFIGGLTAGYRVHLLDIGGAALSVTPHVSLAMTRLRGISLNSTEIGFSRVDAPGAQIALRLGKVRPYVLAQYGKVTIERYVGDDLLNYSGAKWMFGLGMEIPRTNVCGAGFDVAVRRTTGALSSHEWRDPTGTRTAPPGGSIGSTIVTLGWSGRFRGSRLLFACS
jgi:hypothetical protein